MLKKTIKDNKALVKVNGRIDVESSPLFRKELAEINYERIKSLVLDFSEVAYISSAGLRELLVLTNKLDEDASFKIINVNSVVADVFEMTQFSQFFEYTLAEEKVDYARMSFKELLAYKVKNGVDKTIFSYSEKSYNWADIERYSLIIADELRL